MSQLRLPLACVLAAATLLLVAAPAQAIRYAAPTAQGSGDCTTAANACTIEEAVEGGGTVPFPPSDEEIVVLPGEHLLTDTLQVIGTMNVHGLDRAARPTLRRTGGVGTAVASYLTAPGTLRHLRVHGQDNGGAVAALNASGAAVYSDLEVVATGATAVGFAARNGALLRDSTVMVAYEFGAAVTGQEGVATKIVNVTAFATGSSSYGVRVSDGGDVSDQTWKLTVVNSIADGVLGDLRASGGNSTDNIDIDVRNSNFAVATQVDAQVNDLGGNQSAPPLLANPGGGDFHQLVGSPTIDAGAFDAQLGAVDYDGNARTLGTAPDIGADEFRPPAGGGPGSPVSPPALPQPAATGGACLGLQNGTRAADRLFGTAGGDLLIGGRGNDLLRGRAGADCLRGGRGRDRLEGSDGDDRLNGGPHADVLTGGAHTDRLAGGEGADGLTGGRGVDRLAGGAGADRLAGDGGVDVHRAGAGADRVSAADGRRELVDCGIGIDRARVDQRDRVTRCEHVLVVG
jgi:Ca2+-binding RTX toxin-like protein